MDIDKIIELSNNKTQKEIAKLFNVSSSTIGRILKKNNINTNRSRLNESKLYFNITILMLLIHMKKHIG
jgi:intein-encoded DNA endonuclease-like protein